MCKQIIDYLPQTELLAMLAEEAAELSQAALKLRRVLDGTNPTPVSYDEAKRSLVEEAADTMLCMRVLPALSDMREVDSVAAKKYVRWIQRLEERARDEQG